MSNEKVFTIRDLKENSPIHLWIIKENEYYPKTRKEANELVLCSKMSGNPLWVGENDLHNISTNAKHVTCQKCLEWLHA